MAQILLFPDVYCSPSGDDCEDTSSGPEEGGLHFPHPSLRDEHWRDSEE